MNPMHHHAPREQQDSRWKCALAGFLAVAAFALAMSLSSVSVITNALRLRGATGAA